MSSGSTHNTFNYLMITFFIGMWYYVSHQIEVLLVLSFIIGTNYLSPDLDLINTKSFNNWGKLKYLWIPYVDFMIHRGVSLFNPRKWSHTPILGTFSRVLYIAVPFVIFTLSIVFVLNIYKYQSSSYKFIFNKSIDTYNIIFDLIKLFYSNFKKEVIVSFFGIESSSLCHILLDFNGKK